MSGAITIERRLANLRAGRAEADEASEGASAGERATTAVDRADRAARDRAAEAAARAARLAAALDAELLAGPGGALVVRRTAPRPIPVDRAALARLPDAPPPEAVLVCLDTETTGLATAAGTVAFLVGLGWWAGDEFHQVQLVLPDYPDEPALLDAIAAHLAGDAWLVTYNGRGFDWPLLTARYRLALRPEPALGGHVDLLPLARRIYRHRLPDARLRSVEAGVLGIQRVGDVDGWEIPGRYFQVVRGGPPELLTDVLRHNDQDVRSLARLLARLASDLGDRRGWPAAPAGDLAGLARAFRLRRRLGEALECVDAALAAPGASARDVAPLEPPGGWVREALDTPWPAPRPEGLDGPGLGAPWTEERLLIDRAHLLRRLGRFGEAVETWQAVGAGPGRLAILAWIEAAKLREHRLGDVAGATQAAERARRAIERRRALGRPDPRLEAAVRHRLDRLRRRAARIA